MAPVTIKENGRLKFLRRHSPRLTAALCWFYVRFYLRFLVLCLTLVRFGSDEVEAQMERFHGRLS